MPFSLPRLASGTIVREALLTWVTRYVDLPLRVCLAPAGAGKTTALVEYARTRSSPLLYFHLEHQHPDRLLETMLASLCNDGEYSYRAVLSALRSRAPTEIVFDGIERLSEAEEQLLVRLISDLPAQVSVLAAGTRTGLPLQRLEIAGLAKCSPPQLLRLSIEETEKIAQNFGLPMHEEQLAAICEGCDGWAIAVTAVLRSAVEGDKSLVDAHEKWLLQSGQSFCEYIDGELQRLGSEEQELFQSLLQGKPLSDQEGRRLEACGAFVQRIGGVVRPYQLVGALLGSLPVAPILPQTPLQIRLFGRFIVRSGEREVVWMRRRDQQLFRYLAIRPEGRASKAEVIAAFWPEADRHLASQSLRTACSNIRKALATAFEQNVVEQLFVSEAQGLRVNLDLALVDVRRFKAHINAASAAEEQGSRGDAIAHYTAAIRLYRADLFAGEPEEMWFVPQRQAYREMLAFARERSAALREGEFIAN